MMQLSWSSAVLKIAALRRKGPSFIQVHYIQQTLNIYMNVK